MANAAREHAKRIKHEVDQGLNSRTRLLSSHDCMFGEFKGLLARSASGREQYSGNGRLTIATERIRLCRCCRIWRSLPGAAMVPAPVEGSQLRGHPPPDLQQQCVRLLVGEQISLSGMVVVLLRYRGSRSCAPGPRAAKRCRLSKGYRRKGAWARIGFGASDPCRKWSVHRSSGNRSIPPREMPASIAVGLEHGRTNPLVELSADLGHGQTNLRQARSQTDSIGYAHRITCAPNAPPRWLRGVS